MKKIWFEIWFGDKTEYSKTLSFDRRNALFDIWIQKDNHHLDEKSNLNYYDFRISILKLEFSVFPNIFYGCK